MKKEYLNVGDVIKEVNKRYLIDDLMITVPCIGRLILNGYLKCNEAQTEYTLKKEYKLLDTDITNEDKEIERDNRFIKIRNEAINKGLWYSKSKN